MAVHKATTVGSILLIILLVLGAGIGLVNNPLAQASGLALSFLGVVVIGAILLGYGFARTTQTTYW